MARFNNAIASLLLLLPVLGLAQPSGVATPDPTYLNVVYSWSADSLTALEKADCQMKSKLKALGFGGGSAAYVIEGTRSPIRLKGGSSLRFAIKLNAMMDPSSVFKLYRFDNGRKTRESSTNNKQVDFNVQRGNNDTYVLVPSVALSPGEYGFVDRMHPSGGGMQMTFTAYAFGIDP